jgi:hypothetical protein
MRKASSTLITSTDPIDRWFIRATASITLVCGSTVSSPPVFDSSSLSKGSFITALPSAAPEAAL